MSKEFYSWTPEGANSVPWYQVEGGLAGSGFSRLQPVVQRQHTNQPTDGHLIYPITQQKHSLAVPEYQPRIDQPRAASHHDCHGGNQQQIQATDPHHTEIGGGFVPSEKMELSQFIQSNRSSSNRRPAMRDRVYSVILRKNRNWYVFSNKQLPINSDFCVAKSRWELSGPSFQMLRQREVRRMMMDQSTKSQT